MAHKEKPTIPTAGEIGTTAIEPTASIAPEASPVTEAETPAAAEAPSGVDLNDPTGTHPSQDEFLGAGIDLSVYGRARSV